MACYIIEDGMVSFYNPATRFQRPVTDQMFTIEYNPGDKVYSSVRECLAAYQQELRDAAPPPPPPVIDPNAIPQNFTDDATYLKFIDAHPDLSVRIKAKKAYESTRK